MIPIFTGKVTKGSLLLTDSNGFKVWLAGLEGKDVEVTVKKKVERRTAAQNAYYWSVVIPVSAKHLGYDNEEMHEAFKFQFLKKHEDILPTVGSTTKLSTAEMVDYIDRIMRFMASEYGCYIPAAGEVEL